MTRAPSVGVAVGVGVLGVAAVLQVVLAVLLLVEEGDVGVALVGLVLAPALVLAGLLRPVRRDRWPLDVRRAWRVGLLWTVLGLPGPMWMFLGQVPLTLCAVAGVPALLGAAWGWARAD